MAGNRFRIELNAIACQKRKNTIARESGEKRWPAENESRTPAGRPLRRKLRDKLGEPAGLCLPNFNKPAGGGQQSPSLEAPATADGGLQAPSRNTRRPVWLFPYYQRATELDPDFALAYARSWGCPYRFWMMAFGGPQLEKRRPMNSALE